MVDQGRARRLAKRIMTIVATELEHRVKDPRLAMITITDAKVTPDLRDAKVYYTVFGTDEEVASTAAALSSATGVLRSAVGRDTGVKFTPTLAFVLDQVPDTARQFDDLLAQVKASDAEIAARAAGATFAGDPDPYRKPADEADEDGTDLDGADRDGADDESDVDAKAADRAGA